MDCIDLSLVQFAILLMEASIEFAQELVKLSYISIETQALPVNFFDCLRQVTESLIKILVFALSAFVEQQFKISKYDVTFLTPK